ncbi:MAG TPA: universal stress protein [Polyangia bacterium]
MAAFRKILVATDFSPDAAQAITVATDLARACGSEIVLVHVCQMPAYSFANGAMYIPTPELVADILRDANRGLLGIKERIRDVAVETVRLEGDPAQEIVRLAGEREVDLIVMGTHGRRGIRRWLAGSVAEHVVRAASCPVLTVHAPAESHAIAGAA